MTSYHLTIYQVSEDHGTWIRYRYPFFHKPEAERTQQQVQDFTYVTVVLVSPSVITATRALSAVVTLRRAQQRTRFQDACIKHLCWPLQPSPPTVPYLHFDRYQQCTGMRCPQSAYLSQKPVEPGPRALSVVQLAWHSSMTRIASLALVGVSLESTLTCERAWATR